tara:strand:- start:977 stop:1906 length:930 start_codon:yes stop_codon:yes gene_type:complete
MWVTEKIKKAVKESQSVEEGEWILNNLDYSEILCGKVLSNTSIKFEPFEESLNRCKPYGMSDEDIPFYMNLYEQNSRARCCLPKGHSGKCVKSYEKYFGKRFQSKLADCHQAPGADDIIFKNRTNRSFPLILDKDNETIIRDRFKLKQKVKLKAAIPSKQASTPLLAATACFDMAALLTHQYDPNDEVFSKRNELDDFCIQKLKEHADRLNKQYKMQYNIDIFDREGYLCDPLTLQKFMPEYWTTKDKKSSNQIQFCHVYPVRSDKFMTRGMNILPMTRRTNMQQGDEPFPIFIDNLIETAKKHQEIRG